MALTSPGVEVTVVDQSQYLPAPTNSVAFVLLATAENKANPNGTGIAQATTAANANKLFRVTSQRDLVTLYGNPFFYTTSDGTPIQGYELNEYGLLAAYSALGVTNQVLCLRADIDLASLVGQTGRPTGNPENGTYWLDTTDSTWGMYEFNSVTGTFSLQLPIVITDASSLSSGVPLASIGSIGDYAVNAIQITSAPTAATSKQFFYKNSNNEWVGLGTPEWLASVPTVVSNNAPTSLTGADQLTISLEGTGVSATLTGITSVAALSTAINNLGWEYLSSEVNSQGRLVVYSKQTNLIPSTPKGIVFTDTAGNMTEDLGISEDPYYQPAFVYGSSAQQPLWTSSQTYPRPTGSVWIKVGAAGNGMLPVVSQWNDTAGIWAPKTVNLATSDWAATASLDATGGQAIVANTIYAQYNYDNEFNQGPVYLWSRIATGPTVVTGTNTAPDFTSGPYTATVQVTVPGSNALSSTYTLTVPDNSDATDFVTAWSAAGIPLTQASVTTSGAIQIVHTEGGEIVINDIDLTTGVSNGLLLEAGLVAGSTDGCKLGPANELTFTVGIGSGNCEIDINSYYSTYNIGNIAVPGTGYSAGQTFTIPGTSLGGTTPANDLKVQVTDVGGSGEVTAVTVASDVSINNVAAPSYSTQLSNWYEFTYTANEGAPTSIPANLTNWYYSVVDEVDIMVNYNGQWRGYSNQNYDSSGFPAPGGTNSTDPNGPIISASEPTVNSEGDPLVPGDIWISTVDLENYPIIYRYQTVDGENQWVLIDNADQTNPTGILFADARWSSSGAINPVDDPIPTIQSLLVSDYVDLDAPAPSLYPTGMLLFNTRRSGYNVKQFRRNYFTQNNFPDAGVYNPGNPTDIANLPAFSYTWVSASGLQANRAPYMGRKAQRAMVVRAMRAAIDTNVAIRDEDNFFNLMATPNYPELQPNMVVLNADRGETAYILGDTPMRLPDDATAIQAWATNAAGATATGEDGLVTRNTYLGLFYPSGIAPDLQGNLVAVPASHMMLRTFLRNDTIAYPWLAAAGTRRGIIDNATNIGYISPTTGEFVTIRTRIGIRDVLYTNFINPLVFFTGNGLLNYGNKTSFNSQSALDRTNVARLVAYIRRQLTLAARPFVFEPNDAITRAEISGVVESLMVDLVAKRGIYDYLVVCDLSNNTPARIDRNELWVDVAIEPVKAAEFIYIPVRILNTGELSAF